SQCADHRARRWILRQTPALRPPVHLAIPPDALAVQSHSSDSDLRQPVLHGSRLFCRSFSAFCAIDDLVRALDCLHRANQLAVAGIVAPIRMRDVGQPTIHAECVIWAHFHAQPAAGTSAAVDARNWLLELCHGYSRKTMNAQVVRYWQQPGRGTVFDLSR